MPVNTYPFNLHTSEPSHPFTLTGTFFQTKKWLSVWNKHFRKDGFVIEVSEKNVVIGYGYFCRENKRIEFLGTGKVAGGELVSDYGDLVAAAGKEKIVWEEIIGLFKKEYRGWELKLDFVRENSPSFKVLSLLGLNKVKSDTAPALALPTSWDDYLLSLKRKDRQELKRKIRRLEAQRIEFVYNAGSSPSEIDSLLKLMSQSDPKKSKFLSEEMKSFFRDLVTSLPASVVVLSFLREGNKKIAATISFAYAGRVYLYNSGYDLNYSHIAPGLILKAYLTRKAIEKKYKVFDFLRGNEPYKYDLGGIDNQLYTFKFNL